MFLLLLVATAFFAAYSGANCEVCEGAHGPSTDWWDKLSEITIAAFTVVLAISTIGLWKVTAKAADAAEKSAVVAENALLVGERPYIFAIEAALDPPLDRTTFNYSGPEIFVSLVYKFANHGRTPAMVTEVCAESICALALPTIPEYRENRIYDARRLYPPATTENFITVLKTPIDGQLMNDIGIGTRRLFAYGYVKYEDIFGYTNIVGFCWRYNLNLKRFFHEDHAAYNYRKSIAPAKVG